MGCVVVKDNSVISSGVTSNNGRPHAEFNALNKKNNFKGSYMYVTLEPCNHYGKTPPCTKIIKRKKVTKPSDIMKTFFAFLLISTSEAFVPTTYVKFGVPSTALYAQSADKAIKDALLASKTHGPTSKEARRVSILFHFGPLHLMIITS